MPNDRLVFGGISCHDIESCNSTKTPSEVKSVKMYVNDSKIFTKCVFLYICQRFHRQHLNNSSSLAPCSQGYFYQ